MTSVSEKIFIHTDWRYVYVEKKPPQEVGRGGLEEGVQPVTQMVQVVA